MAKHARVRRRRSDSIVRGRSSVVWLSVVCTAAACSLDVGGPGNDSLLLRPNGDVLAAAATISRLDSVPGDVMVAGRSVEFDGYAGGSFLGAAGAQDLEGRIDGSVRAVGGSLRLGTTVGRNITVAGGSIDVAGEADVGGNAYLAGGSVVLEGSIAGDVYVGAGDVELNGAVGGDVRAEAGTLSLGPEASIGGELRYRLGEGAVATISPDAVVAGGVTELEPRDEGGGGTGLFVLRLLAFVLCGAILVALLPGTLVAAVDKMRARPAAALGLGLVWLLLVPFVVVLAAVTLVGVPLALILAALYALSLYLAPVVPAVWIGGEILSGRDPLDRKSAVVLFVTGGAIVAFAILLPWLGLVARALAASLGLGAVILMIRDRGSSVDGSPSGQH